MVGYPDFSQGMDYPDFSQGMGYPDPMLPSFVLDDPSMPQTNSQMQDAMAMLEDYKERWNRENEQNLDDWEYFYYGIPAGNETFIGLGD